MLAGRTERRDVPHAPGEWVEFRTLSGRELDEAEEIQARRAMELVKGLDMSQLRGQVTEGVKATPTDAYDKDTLTKYGIAAWSLIDECNTENKQRLDAETRNWAVGVILEMNVRPPGEVNGFGGNSVPEGSRLNSPEPIESSPAG